MTFSAIGYKRMFVTDPYTQASLGYANPFTFPDGDDRWMTAHA